LENQPGFASLNPGYEQARSTGRSAEVILLQSRPRSFAFITPLRGF